MIGGGPPTTKPERILTTPSRSAVVLSSLISGAAATAVGHPADCVKVRVQTNGGASWRTAAMMWRHEGSMAFIRGGSFPLANSLLMNTIIFVAFTETQAQGSEGFALCLSGAMAGVAASFVGTPFDRLKIMRQLQSSAPKGTSASSLHQIGFRGMYSGHLMNMLREGVFGAIYLGIYAQVKAVYLNQNPGTTLPLGLSALLSGLTGGLAWAVVFPFDTIKTRQQASSHRPSATSIAYQIWVEGGLGAFYNGISAGTSRALLVTSVRLVTYEWCLHKVSYS